MPATTTATPAFDTDTAARLRTAIGRLSRRLRSTAASREAGLTPTATSVLLAVVRGGPVKLSELASTEGINPTMLSRVVAGMADAGLISRSVDVGDRRAAWVSATPAARRLAERIRRERTDAVNAALLALPERERRRVERALPALEGLAEELGARRP